MQHGSKALHRPGLDASILAVVLGLVGLTNLASGRDPDAAIRIPPIRTTFNIENQPVSVTAWGTITPLARQQDAVAFRLELFADLSDLQKNFTEVLAAELNKADHCGDHIEMQHATLQPDEPASMVTAQFHYERYACVKMFGKQTPHRLVGGNAVAQLKLTPEVDDGHTLRLIPELGQIQADGSLGELLHTGNVEQMLREKITHAMLNATQKGTDFSATLPPAALGFVTVQGARFKDLGSGRVAVALGGEIHVTPEQAQLLKSQLQERAKTAAIR